MSKAVVLLSGGIDSATCMGMACQEYDSVIPLHISYGQQTGELEKAMAHRQAQNFAENYPETQVLSVEGVNYSPVISHFARGVASERDSFETDDGELTEDDGRSTGYQPMRNLHLIATASGVADVRNADAVYHGTQGGDEADYPDCRPEFMDAAEKAVNASLADNDEIELRTPLIHRSKTEVIEAGQWVGVDFTATYSCYSAVEDVDNPEPCGACPACEERLEAFKELEIEDPIEYAN